MNDVAEHKTLGDALPALMKHIREEVIPPYIEIGPPGAFALALMNASLTRAEHAMASGDVIEMLRCYEDLSDVKPVVALSVRQPWPWLMFHGGKDVENRNWATRYRGPVLIHASKSFTRDEWEDAFDTAAAIWRKSTWPTTPLPQPDYLRKTQCGGIVGQAEIVDCVAESESPWFFGRYGFVLRNARPLAFLPCRGALGFFKPEFPSDSDNRTKVAG
jgi:ASCH domain